MGGVGGRGGCKRDNDIIEIGLHFRRFASRSVALMASATSSERPLPCTKRYDNARLCPIAQHTTFILDLHMAASFLSFAFAFCFWLGYEGVRGFLFNAPGRTVCMNLHTNVASVADPYEVASDRKCAAYTYKTTPDFSRVPFF